VTAVVKMLNPPALAPAGIVTVEGTDATAGLLLVTGRARSADCGDAIRTVANEPPLWPTVDVGFSVSDAGCACGVNVTGACIVVPFHDAVTVAVVGAETALVGSETEAENDPAAMNTDAGGVTAGELLDSVTDAPPGGACPVSMTIAVGWAPPVMLEGEIDSDLSAVGVIVIRPDADFELRVAVIVASTGAATCPACIWNCVHAVLPGIVIVAGTGAALGFELARAIVAPVGGTAEVSCTATHVVLPLATGFVVALTETGVGGAVLTVKLRTCDHAVSAAVVDDASPCADRTRQNFVPAVSDVSV
jgi:hypothetical protein